MNPKVKNWLFYFGGLEIGILLSAIIETTELKIVKNYGFIDLPTIPALILIAPVVFWPLLFLLKKGKKKIEQP